MVCFNTQVLWEGQTSSLQFTPQSPSSHITFCQFRTQMTWGVSFGGCAFTMGLNSTNNWKAPTCFFFHPVTTTALRGPSLLLFSEWKTAGWRSELINSWPMHAFLFFVNFKLVCKEEYTKTKKMDPLGLTSVKENARHKDRNLYVWKGGAGNDDFLIAKLSAYWVQGSGLIWKIVFEELEIV